MIILIKENIEKHTDSEEKAAVLEMKGYRRLRNKPKVDYSTMTKAQLIECAKKRGIDVNLRMRKAEILAAL